MKQSLGVTPSLGALPLPWCRLGHFGSTPMAPRLAEGAASVGGDVSSCSQHPGKIRAAAASWGWRGKNNPLQREPGSFRDAFQLVSPIMCTQLRFQRCQKKEKRKK